MRRILVNKWRWSNVSNFSEWLYWIDLLVWENLLGKVFFVLLTITAIFFWWIWIVLFLAISIRWIQNSSRFFLEYLRYLYCKRVHQLSKNFCITASIAFLMERCVQSMSMMALYHKDIVLFYKCMYLKIMFIKDHFMCLWFSHHSLIVTSRCVLYLC